MLKEHVKYVIKTSFILTMDILSYMFQCNIGLS